jgi:tetratricopeptide (TPR) repeat protein
LVHRNPPPELTKRAHAELADAYSFFNDTDKAIPHFEAILATDPKNAQVLYRLGLANCAVGKVSEGKEEVARARKLDPQLDPKTACAK